MKAKKTAAYVMLCFVISVFLLVTGTIAFAENDILYIGDGVGLGQEEKIVFKTGYGQAEILADTNNGWFRFGTPTLPMGANFMGSLIFGGSLQQNISSPVGGTLKLFSRDEMDIWADKIYLSAGSALQGPDDVNTKVGIGTANPSSMLEISGTNSNADLRLTRINNVSPGSEMGKLTFLAPNASGISRDWAQLRVVVENATANSESAGLAFNTRNGDNSFPERVRIDGKGNVGIGTSNPFAILNLYTNGTSSKSTAGNKDQRLYMQLGSIQSVNDGSEIVFGMQDVGSGRYAAIGTDVKATGLANQISGDIYLATKSLVTDTALTRRMVIQANGNVGIGTTSPNEKLHLYGTSNTFAHIEGGPATTSNGIKMTTNGNIMFVSNENGRMGFFNTSSERMSILNNGNVGIGTITPGQRLDVAGNIKGNALCIGTDCRSSWPVSQNGSGNVGIGTTSPAAKLEIAGIAGTNYSDSTSAGLFVSGTGHNRVQLSTTSTSGHQVAYQMQAGTDTAEFRMAQGVGTLMLGTAGTDRLAITKTGSVGIGTTTPVSKLNVKVGDAGGNPSQSQENIVLESNDNAYISIVTPKAYQSGISFSNDTANARGGIYYGQQSYINADAMRFHTAGAERIRIDNSGNVGIGTTSPDSKLHVAGNGHVTGNLQVDGNIAAKYQDVAEWVKTSEQLTAGTVVMIDPEKANQVIASDKPYNTLVAGVVSEQPGIILGEASEDKAIIAHTGRVRVKVDASNGKISAGDLLVTSSVKGYAMRSEPIDIGGAKIHRPGTIVGKALEPLADGQRGEILVLITLQ